MVYANQRLSCRIRKRLCLRKPNQQRPHQSGTVGHADGIHFFQCHACVRQCLLNDTVNIFNMLSGCNFRHYAAVKRMQVNLRINDVGKHFPAVFDDSRRRFVTGAFNG